MGPLGVATCIPILGPWASDPWGAQFWGVQFLNPPFWVHPGSLAHFRVLGPSGSVGYPYTNGFPTYGSRTLASWGRPKLNSFFTFPIPHTGGNLGVYTKETQPMPRGPTYGSRATIPHTGVNTDAAWPPTSPLHHNSTAIPMPCWTTSAPLLLVSTLKMEVAGLCESLTDQTTRHYNPDIILKRHRNFELVIEGRDNRILLRDLQWQQ